MKLTKKYHFQLPGQLDNFDIEFQNGNWERLDGILLRMERQMTLQVIVRLLLVIFLCGRGIKFRREESSH